MRCGGCGAKVGGTTLSRVMQKIAPLVHRRPDVLVGLDMPDDCAVVAVPDPDGLNGDNNIAMVHTVDYFRTFISDP